MKWYIIVTNCYDCGNDSNLIGPFETEEDAQKYSSSFGGTKGIWHGTCSTTQIIENSLPEDLVEKWRDKINE